MEGQIFQLIQHDPPTLKFIVEPLVQVKRKITLKVTSVICNSPFFWTGSIIHNSTTHNSFVLCSPVVSIASDVDLDLFSEPDEIFRMTRMGPNAVISILRKYV